MVRDFWETEDYFVRFLKSENERIAKFEDAVKNINERELEKVIRCKNNLASFYKNKLTAMYSYGSNKDEIKVVFKDYIELYNHIEVNSYAEMVDILSFCILFDYHDIESVLENDSFNDSLVNVLKTYIRTGELSLDDNDDLQFPKQYSKFLEALNVADKDKSVAILKNYITEDNWYINNDDMYWYDSHKSNRAVYSGYWCWIGAAIIDIKKLDKNIFNDCKFLPRDSITT